MADLVRVRNLSDKAINVAYNSKPLWIGAGQDGFVEKEAAYVHFGVWWSIPGGRPIDRKDEYLRIRGLYGCFPGAPQDGTGPVWEEVKPKVEIYEMDGTRVSTVIDDPEGESIPVTERKDDEHLRDTMAKMQEQLEKMQAQMDTKDKIIAAGNVTDLPPADSPETAPRRKRGRPAIKAAGAARDG